MERFVDRDLQKLLTLQRPFDIDDIVFKIAQSPAASILDFFGPTIVPLLTT